MLYPAELPGLVKQERDYTCLTLQPQHATTWHDTVDAARYISI